MPTLQDRRATLRRHTATTSLTFPPPDLAARQLVYCIADPPILSSSAENGSATAMQGRF